MADCKFCGNAVVAHRGPELAECLALYVEGVKPAEWANSDAEGRHKTLKNLKVR